MVNDMNIPFIVSLVLPGGLRGPGRHLHGGDACLTATAPLAPALPATAPASVSGG